MTNEPNASETRRVWLAAIAYWAVLSLACAWLYPVLMKDSITRYAPMADAFARGDWTLAFHPRFGVLFQVLSGSVAWLSGLSGEKAVQVVAAGMLALSGVPLFFMVKRLLGSRVAWWSLALLFVADDLVRYAMDGLRDPGKCLVFALLGYGAVARRPSAFAAGLFVFVTLFAYGFAVSSVLLFAWCAVVVACAARGRDLGMPAARAVALPVVGWSLGVAAVTVMVHAYTGHWLPAPHYVKVLGGLL